jgi:carbamoyl-phosphate synthase large subunit
VDIILGPEMKSTGEVMGIDYDLGMAFAKSQMAAGGTLPTKGNRAASTSTDKLKATSSGKVGDGSGKQTASTETDRPNVVLTPTF